MFEVSGSNLNGAFYRKRETRPSLEEALELAETFAKEFQVVSIWEPMNVKPLARWFKGDQVRVLGM